MIDDSVELAGQLRARRRASRHERHHVRGGQGKLRLDGDAAATVSARSSMNAAAALPLGTARRRRWSTTSNGVRNARPTACSTASRTRAARCASCSASAAPTSAPASNCQSGTDTNPAPGATIFAGRVTTPIFGLGLVDSLPDSTFQTLAAAAGRDRGHGRVRHASTDPRGRSRAGNTPSARFGWKAVVTPASRTSPPTPT